MHHHMLSPDLTTKQSTNNLRTCYHCHHRGSPLFIPLWFIIAYRKMVFSPLMQIWLDLDFWRCSGKNCWSNAATHHSFILIHVLDMIWYYFARVVHFSANSIDFVNCLYVWAFALNFQVSFVCLYTADNFFCYFLDCSANLGSILTLENLIRFLFYLAIDWLISELFWVFYHFTVSSFIILIMNKILYTRPMTLSLSQIF